MEWSWGCVPSPGTKEPLSHLEGVGSFGLCSCSSGPNGHHRHVDKAEGRCSIRPARVPMVVGDGGGSPMGGEGCVPGGSAGLYKPQFPTTPGSLVDALCNVILPSHCSRCRPSWWPWLRVPSRSLDTLHGRCHHQPPAPSAASRVGQGTCQMGDKELGLPPYGPWLGERWLCPSRGEVMSVMKSMTRPCSALGTSCGAPPGRAWRGQSVPVPFAGGSLCAAPIYTHSSPLTGPDPVSQRPKAAPDPPTIWLDQHPQPRTPWPRRVWAEPELPPGCSLSPARGVSIPIVGRTQRLSCH